MFRWNVENDPEGIRFILDVLHQHKNLQDVTMFFVGKIESNLWEALVRAIQTSRITQLGLGRNTIDPMDLSGLLRAIQHMEYLDRLDIGIELNPNESEAIVAALQNPHLREFNGQFNDNLWNATTTTLSTHQYLKTLQIRSEPNTYQKLGQILSSNTALENLRLQPEVDITAEEMNYLVSGLKDNTTLKSLYILQQGEDVEMPMLCEALAHDQIKISKFSFVAENISESTLKSLSRSLRTNTCLKKLKFHGFIAKCQDFGEALKHNSTLEKLKILARKPLPIEISQMICEALKSTSGLTHLHFDNIGGHFGPIADMLSHHTTLKRLVLLSSKLDDESFVHLCEALAKNKTLTDLTLRQFGGYGPERLTLIGNVLKKNNTLRRLTIDSNLDVIFEGLRTNTCLSSVTFSAYINDLGMFEGKLIELLEHSYALTTVKPEHSGMPRVLALLKRNRQLKSEAQFKVAILSHNIARSCEALAMLPREVWIEILSLATHPGMEPFTAMVKKIFGIQH